jgi:3-oxoacyl-ACP reductase-like protein
MDVASNFLKGIIMAKSHAKSWTDGYENESVWDFFDGNARLKAMDAVLGRDFKDTITVDPANGATYRGDPSSSSGQAANAGVIDARIDTDARKSFTSSLLAQFAWLTRAVRMHREDLAILELAAYDWRMAAKMRAAVQRDFDTR